MNKYKLVACDLDGTLLNFKLEVSNENKLAIKALMEQGVYFVPATGRALSEMQEVVNIPDIRYIIYSNGAGILDKKTKKHIRMCMSQETANFVLDNLKAYNSYSIVHYDGKTYAKLMSEDMRRSYNVCPAVCELVSKYANMEKDFEKRAYSMDNVESISVFFKDYKEKEQCKKVLTKDERLYVVDGWECNIEIFNANAGKDKALKQLAEILNINKENIVTIGDSGNDILMTKSAGLGLSVSNGCEELKAVADGVICSNNEHAVKYILSKYF